MTNPYFAELFQRHKSNPILSAPDGGGWVIDPQLSFSPSPATHSEEIFPCGWVVEGDEVRLYYGAAETSVALATGSLKELPEFIRNSPLVDGTK